MTVLADFSVWLESTSLSWAMPWAVLGFVVNLITGVLFFVGEPQST